MAWASVVLVVWVLGGTSETECIECPTLFFLINMVGRKPLKYPMDASNTILHIPYKKLPISNSLKRVFAVHGFSTLGKLMEITPKDLFEMKWFNAHLYLELIGLLEDNGLLEDWGKS